MVKKCDVYIVKSRIYEKQLRVCIPLKIVFRFGDNSVQGHKKLDEKDTTYFERKRLQMMRNLQITIRNFHISYETISTTKLGHPFSFGLTISYMEMTVSNDRTNINEENIRLFRLVPINNLLEELKNILWWYSRLE